MKRRSCGAVHGPPRSPPFIRIAGGPPGPGRSVGAPLSGPSAAGSPSPLAGRGAVRAPFVGPGSGPGCAVARFRDRRRGRRGGRGCAARRRGDGRPGPRRAGVAGAGGGVAVGGVPWAASVVPGARTSVDAPGRGRVLTRAVVMMRPAVASAHRPSAPGCRPRTRDAPSWRRWVVRVIWSRTRWWTAWARSVGGMIAQDPRSARISRRRRRARGPPR